MALGTPTIQFVREIRDGGQDIGLQFLGDTATPSGGTADFQDFVRDAIKAAHDAASDKNVRGEEAVTVLSFEAGDCGVYKPVFDFANDKLKVLKMTDGTEATGDLSGTTFNGVVRCK